VSDLTSEGGDVDFLRLKCSLKCSARPTQDVPEPRGFVCGQLSYVLDVALGLQNEEAPLEARDLSSE
jgi:hypothetical protein